MKGEQKRTWRRRGFEKNRAESQRAQRDARNCTLKTAQPDGKHLVKKPVAKNNFAVGLRISESKNNL